MDHEVATRPAGDDGPLSGVLVADFSRVLAGPHATMLLADLGADVIKVESPAGDETRTWTPPARGETSTYYLSLNRNKRSLVLDLREEADAALGRELARRADVLVQNFKVGGLDRYGLDFPSVRAANPGIVYASISGFGAGAGARLPGYDLMVQAVSGLMSLTGEPDGPAYRAGISVIDLIAANHTAVGILAALRHRDATGEGQHVEVSLLGSALFGMLNQSSAYIAGGVVPFRMGNGHPSVYPYEPFPTADRDMVIAVANNGQFARLCGILGAPELPEDPRFRTNGDRTVNRAALRTLLIERLAARGATEWFDALVAAGVPCGPINTVDGGFATAADLGLDPVVEVGEGERAVPTTRNPVRLSATPATYRLPPPELDEHGGQLRRWLAEPPGPADRPRALAAGPRGARGGGAREVAREVELPDGRRLRVHDSGGAPDAPVVLWHHGSPQTGALLAPLVAAAAARGLRVVSYARPSYGGSTPDPGRTVASAAADVERVADALGLARFAVMGASGGGPHAMACAALLPGRVSGVATLAGIAPFTEEFDWWAGMVDDSGLRAAVRGRPARERAAASEEFDESSFIAADWAALTGDWAPLGADAGRALDDGPDGLVTDDLAFVAPWGFELEKIEVPTLVVQGGQDRVVPPAHGDWLARRCPRSELWLRPRDGHVSVLAAVPLALDWLSG